MLLRFDAHSENGVPTDQVSFATRPRVQIDAIAKRVALA
jgi:hypothetical protein